MEIEFSSRGLLTAFFRHKIKALFVFLAIIAAGMHFLANQVPNYAVSASMIVKFGQEAVPNLSLTNTTRASETPKDKQEVVNSLISLLKSTDLLREVVAEVGATKLYPDLAAPAVSHPLEKAVNRLRDKDLLPANTGETNLITLKVYNPDPEVATEFTSLLISRFIKRQAEIFTPQRTDFLDEQIEGARKTLLKAQEDFLAFKTETKISNLEQEMQQLIAERGSLSTLSFGVLTEARNKLADLESQRAGLLATHRADSIMVDKINQSIAVARARVAQIQNDLENTTRREESLGLNGKTSKKGDLSTRIAEIDARIKYLENNRGRYQDLEQKVQASEESYTHYQKRGEDARLNAVLNEHNITRITIVDTPTASPYPVKPDKDTLALLIVIVALCAALGVAFLLEIIDDRLTSPQQLSSALRAPVLVSYDRKDTV